MMKKIALFFAAVAFVSVANAQFVVGVQGGYYQQNTSNGEYMLTFHDNRTTTTEYTTSTVNWLGGLQLGYQITPKLYAGVAGEYLKFSTESNILRDSILPSLYGPSYSQYGGMWMPVDNHRNTTERSGWSVSPVVRYEFLKYGNMHFNLMLQGTVRSLGYTTSHEYFNKPFDNNELLDRDPVIDSISNFTWGVSLRPTLVYEFSKHLSAELSLDFLSVGYIHDVVNHDGNEYVYQATDYEHVNPPTVIAPHKETTSTIYAGLNTLMETLKWESPMLRLGFNYKF